MCFEQQTLLKTHFISIFKYYFVLTLLKPNQCIKDQRIIQNIPHNESALSVVGMFLYNDAKLVKAKV